MGASVGGGRGKRRLNAEMNVVPYIDVMLVLLIIFMVTAPVMMSQLPISLPKPSLVPPKDPHDPLIVSVDIQGNYYIDSGSGNVQQVAYTDLPAKLSAIAAADPDNLVFVRADKADRYGKVVDLLQIVGSVGFSKVSLMSEAKQQS